MAYVKGYLEAADLVAASSDRETRATLDYVVYPTIFLYRHHLELMLKHLRNVIDTELQRTAPARPKHSLLYEWNLCEAFLEKAEPGERSSLAGVRNVLRQFDDIDPHPGTNFRYAEKLDGGDPLPGHEWLNLATVSDATHSVSEYLESWAMHFEMDQQHRAEYQMSSDHDAQTAFGDVRRLIQSSRLFSLGVMVYDVPHCK